MKAFRKSATVAVALALAFAQPANAFVEFDPTGGGDGAGGGGFGDGGYGGYGGGGRYEEVEPDYGNAIGDSLGEGGFGDIVESDAKLPTVTVIGRRSPESWYYWSNVVDITVTAPQLWPRESNEVAPDDPVTKEQCISNCNTRQSLANDLCAIAAAKAAARDTYIAIGAGFVVGAAISWRLTLLAGAPAGYAAYLVTRDIARDFSSQANLVCLATAAQAHIKCLTGKCHV